MDPITQPSFFCTASGGDVSFWDPHWEALAARFRLIAVDLRGSGLTRTSSPTHEISDLADDVVAVLDESGVERAHVLGFSMDGYVAQSFAVRHPARLDRLVLAATSPALHPRSRAFVDTVLHAYVSGLTEEQMYGLGWSGRGSSPRPS